MPEEEHTLTADCSVQGEDDNRIQGIRWAWYGEHIGKMTNAYRVATEKPVWMKLSTRLRRT